MNKFILLPVNMFKTDGDAKPVDPDQTTRSAGLIWVYTVCSGFSKYLT